MPWLVELWYSSGCWQSPFVVASEAISSMLIGLASRFYCLLKGHHRSRWGYLTSCLGTPRVSFQAWPGRGARVNRTHTCPRQVSSSSALLPLQASLSSKAAHRVLFTGPWVAFTVYRSHSAYCASPPLSYPACAWGTDGDGVRFREVLEARANSTILASVT